MIITVFLPPVTLHPPPLTALYYSFPEDHKAGDDEDDGDGDMENYEKE